MQDFFTSNNFVNLIGGSSNAGTNSLSDSSIAPSSNWLLGMANKIKFDVLLAPTSWMKCGGRTKVLFRPTTEEELILFLSSITPELRQKVVVLGATSNTIIRDGGIDGIVIRLGPHFANVSIQNHTQVVAGAAALDANVAMFASKNNLSELEFLSTIPGTIGGNVKMNAGCYGKEIKDILESITAVDLEGKKLIIPAKDIPFSYRHNALPNNLIFTSATFNCIPKSRAQIVATIEEMKSKRIESQPLGQHTTGSTFANPTNTTKKAWQLLDECGMRGYKISNSTLATLQPKHGIHKINEGGIAKFSEVHCNFLINTGGATSSQFEELIDLAVSKVLQKTGIELKLEIQIIGNK